MPAWLSILVRAGKRKITCCWTAHEEGSRRPRGDVNVRKTVRAHTDSRGNGRAGAPTRKFGLVVPLLNRGTAFAPRERHALGLTGLLPSGVSTMEGQLRRTYAQYSRQPDDLNKNVYLANLRDRNEVLFYRLLTEHIQEMLPIVYTPTIGEAIERFSHEFRRTRGVYLSVDAIEAVEVSFRKLRDGSKRR
jgi:hypothetical protein